MITHYLRTAYRHTVGAVPGARTRGCTSWDFAGGDYRTDNIGTRDLTPEPAAVDEFFSVISCSTFVAQTIRPTFACKFLQGADFDDVCSEGLML